MQDQNNPREEDEYNSNQEYDNPIDSYQSQPKIRLSPLSHRQGPSVYRPRPPPETNQCRFANSVTSFITCETQPIRRPVHLPQPPPPPPPAYQDSYHGPLPSIVRTVYVPTTSNSVYCLQPRPTQSHHFRLPESTNSTHHLTRQAHPHPSSETQTILENQQDPRRNRREAGSRVLDDERICRFVDRFTQQISRGPIRDEEFQPYVNNQCHYNPQQNENVNIDSRRLGRSHKQEEGNSVDNSGSNIRLNNNFNHNCGQVGPIQGQRSQPGSERSAVALNPRGAYYQPEVPYAYYPNPTPAIVQYPLVPFQQYPGYGNPYQNCYQPNCIAINPSGHPTQQSGGYIYPQQNNFVYAQPQQSYTHFPQHNPSAYYSHRPICPFPFPTQSHENFSHPQFPNQQPSQGHLPAQSYFSQSTASHRQVNQEVLNLSQVTLKTTQVETTVAAATSTSSFRPGGGGGGASPCVSVYPSMETLGHLPIPPIGPQTASTPNDSYSPPLSQGEGTHTESEAEEIRSIAEAIPIAESVSSTNNINSLTPPQSLPTSPLPHFKVEGKSSKNHPMFSQSVANLPKCETPLEVKGETKSESNIWDTSSKDRKNQRTPWCMKHTDSEEKLRRVLSENAISDLLEPDPEPDEWVKKLESVPPTRSTVRVPKPRIGVRQSTTRFDTAPSQEDIFQEMESDLHSKTLEEGITLLESKEWMVNVVGLKVVTLQCRKNWEEIVDELHIIVPLVHKHLQSPKSKLCRQAICCMRDLFLNLGCNMDSQLERVSERLFNKTMDTNKFIKGETETTLEAMVRMCSPAKVIHCLETVGKRHRNVTVRRMTCKMIRVLIQYVGPDVSLKEFSDKLLPMLITFLDEPAVEMRMEAKNALKLLIPLPGFNTCVKRYVNPDLIRGVADRLEKLKDEIFNRKRKKIPKHLQAIDY